STVVEVDIEQSSKDMDNEVRSSVQSSREGDEAEYWAVLMAVGEYAGHPDENRPSMWEAVDNLYETLLLSEHWQEDHIMVLKGMECTAINMVEALRWLADNDDENDISLVYITTLGFQGPDLPPFDESDGKDEYLVTYYGLEKFYTCIWDDELNFLLSRLDSAGVAVIVDSSYSGGMGDAINSNAKGWAEEFAADIAGNGRVILMSCGEAEDSYGSYFSNYVAEGLKGYADADRNDLCSAEEAFDYAETLTLALAEDWGVNWHPQMYDNYPGELMLTETIMTDRLDQQQTSYCGWGWGCWGDGAFAQSFVPTVSTLTRVSLYCWKEGSPGSLEISLCHTLEGDNIASESLDPDCFSGNSKWIEFDLPDTPVNPYETYYIVWHQTSGDSDNVYYWCYGADNPYAEGEPWYFNGRRWENYEDASEDNGFYQIDFCFKTYGEM
ncbi:MAG: caspase family protein, partial [Thermoplasmatota archaeon]